MSEQSALAEPPQFEPAEPVQAAASSASTPQAAVPTVEVQAESTGAPAQAPIESNAATQPDPATESEPAPAATVEDQATPAATVEPTAVPTTPALVAAAPEATATPVPTATPEPTPVPLDATIQAPVPTAGPLPSDAIEITGPQVDESERATISNAGALACSSTELAIDFLDLGDLSRVARTLNEAAGHAQGAPESDIAALASTLAAAGPNEAAAFDAIVATLSACTNHGYQV